MSRGKSRGVVLGPLIFFGLLGVSIYFVVLTKQDEFIPAGIPPAMRMAANQWLDISLPPIKVEKVIAEDVFDDVIEMANKNMQARQGGAEKYGLIISTRPSQTLIQENWPKQSVRQAFVRLCALGGVQCELNDRGQFVVTPQ